MSWVVLSLMVSWYNTETLLALNRLATLGARLFTPSRPDEVRMLIIKGRDFPSKVLDTLRDWRVALWVLDCSGAATARGTLHYGKDESGMSQFLLGCRGR